MGRKENHGRGQEGKLNSKTDLMEGDNPWVRGRALLTNRSRGGFWDTIEEGEKSMSGKRQIGASARPHKDAQCQANRGIVGGKSQMVGPTDAKVGNVLCKSSLQPAAKKKSKTVGSPRG